MHVPARLLTAIVMTLALFTESTARAGIENRNILPLGEREVFTANAGVGGGKSSGAVYYNPGALADLVDARISFSGTTYAYSKVSADAYARLDNTDLGYHASGFDTIPNLVVSSVRRGDWTLAFSALVPDSITVNNRLTWPTPNTKSTIVQSQTLSDLWIGASAATRVDEDWAIGFTLFGIQHKESTMLGVFVTFPAQPNVALINQNQIQSSIWGFSGTFGVLYNASDWLDLGLRIQSPFIRVTGSAAAYNFTQDPTATPQVKEREDKDIAANYGLPLDFSLGSRLFVAEWLNLLFDVSLQTGLTYEPYPSSQFAGMVSTRTAPRFNLGLDFMLADDVTAQMGGLYNISAISLDGRAPGDTSEDYYGVTLGLNFGAGRVRTGIGGFYLRSSGKVIPVGTTGTAQQDFRSERLGAILSFTYML